MTGDAFRTALLPFGASFVLFLAMLALSAPPFAAAIAALALFLGAFLAARNAGRAPASNADRDSSSAADVTRIVLDALPVPALIVDWDLDVLAANPQAHAAFGSFGERAHLTARFRAPALLDLVRSAVVSGRSVDGEYAPPGPEVQIYKVMIEPMQPLEGMPPSLLITFLDMSEARRIDRMRTDFVANASHELRTPLASLRGFIETMQGPARNDAAAREKFLGIMLDQVNRMSRLVDDLMSLSRLEIKAKISPQSEVELTGLIRTVGETLAPLATELGVMLALDLPEDRVVIRGDRDELTEVFENLIENALKYGHRGGRAEVSMSGKPGEGLSVSVADDGPGIPPEHVPRLTERFYRVNVEHSRHRKGTGLGLAIVKHILTRHNAQLVIRSEIGKGSVFTVRF